MEHYSVLCFEKPVNLSQYEILYYASRDRLHMIG